MKTGDRVVVWAKNHPHDGLRGVITELFVILGQSAMVMRDDGKGFNVISMKYLIEEKALASNPEKPEFVKS